MPPPGQAVATGETKGRVMGVGRSAPRTCIGGGEHHPNPVALARAERSAGAWTSWVKSAACVHCCAGTAAPLVPSNTTFYMTGPRPPRPVQNGERTARPRPTLHCSGQRTPTPTVTQDLRHLCTRGGDGGWGGGGLLSQTGNLAKLMFCFRGGSTRMFLLLDCRRGSATRANVCSTSGRCVTSFDAGVDDRQTDWDRGLRRSRPLWKKGSIGSFPRVRSVDAVHSLWTPCAICRPCAEIVGFVGSSVTWHLIHLLGVSAGLGVLEDFGMFCWRVALGIARETRPLYTRICMHNGPVCGRICIALFTEKWIVNAIRLK